MSSFACQQDDMNLSEEKKEPLRLQPNFRKKEMLAMHMKGTVQVCDVITLFFFANLRVSETQWLFLVFRRNTATDSIPLKITSHIWATRIWVSIKFIAVWNLWGSPWPIIHLLGSTTLFARDWIRFWIFSTNATEGGFQCRFVSLTVFIDRVFFYLHIVGTRDGTRSNTSASGAWKPFPTIKLA